MKKNKTPHKKNSTTMASFYYTKCLCLFFIFALAFSLQTHARESKFFSKFPHFVTKSKSIEDSTTTTTTITVSPTQSPAPAPAPESDDNVTEHGYGLYGSEEYRYPPTTTDPVKTGRVVGKEEAEKYVPAEELSKDNFKEFEMTYGNGNRNGNENGNGKEGMSDTRFMENGKYYYDVNNKEVMDENTYNGNGHGKEGMSDTRFMENGKYYYDANNEDVKDENTYNGNGNEYVSEKQGMSDTRFMENGKYYYDVNQDKKDENSFLGENGNGNGNGKEGMSDTRYLENGKYYYDLNNEGVKEENSYNNGNGYENGNGYVTPRIGEYNYNSNGPNEYVSEEGRGGYNGKPTKKLPNTYDTMEEYEKEEEYKASQNGYIP